MPRLPSKPSPIFSYGLPFGGYGTGWMWYGICVKPDAFAKTPIVDGLWLDVEDEAKDAGVDFFMIKPFEPSDLHLCLIGCWALTPLLLK